MVQQTQAHDLGRKVKQFKRSEIRRLTKVMNDGRKHYDQLLLGYKPKVGLVYVEVKGHDDSKSYVMWEEGARLSAKFRWHLFKKLVRIIFGKGGLY